MDQSAKSPLSVLEKLRTSAELNAVAKARLALVPGSPMYTFKAASAAAKMLSLAVKLGVDLSGPRLAKAAFAADEAPEVPEAPRVDTGAFYDYDDDRTKGQRKKFNTAAIALLAEIDAGTVDGANLTAEQKATLAKYSGTGGNLVGADGLKGSDYEYYTPKPIADGMWNLLAELGFKGGKVLDPCAGTGVFGAAAPANAAVESIELNATSGRINQLVNGGPAYNAVVSPFEAIAAKTEDEIYDAVVTNVPFGDKHARGENRRLDDRYRDASLETYFIMRSLEKLRPGGLAAFIVPPRCVSEKGGSMEKLRTRVSYLAEFMGAYRLPNSVFGTADADTITDVIVFRKFSRDALAKVQELKAQAPDLLVSANVLWQEFIDGRYFSGEGRRFVLGEFQAKDPNKFRDVDRVISDASIPNIARLMRKFPGTRIDWKAIDSAETEPIEYREGDTLVLAGQTLEMTDGRWVPVKGDAAAGAAWDAVGAKLSTPVSACEYGVAWTDADGFAKHLISRSQEMELPDWMRTAWRDVTGHADAARGAAWAALVAGLACVQATQEHGSDPQFNYVDLYPAITAALQATAADRKPLATYRQSSKAALEKARITYTKKAGFSAQWRGDGAAGIEIGRLSEEEKFRAAKYESQSVQVPLAKLKEIYGEGFDPLNDDEWCVNAEGTHATKADDYYVGNLADFLARIDGEIAAAEGTVRLKLMRQREDARQRVATIDVKGLRYNLFSPFVEMEEKAEFLRRFSDPGWSVVYDDDGEKRLAWEGGKSVSDTAAEAERKRQLKRFAIYLRGGNMSTGTKAEDIAADKDLDPMRRKMLRDMSVLLNTNFDMWVKKNPMIMDRMQAKADDPARLYFVEPDDMSPLEIAGMSKAINPKTGKPLSLHGFQRAFVRKQGRKFGGINGFDVGLGKTFTSLAATQYVHSIGVKKKTIFVVPNSVLSNWRREAGVAYASTDDCLFVGLNFDKNGKPTVEPGDYARDFTRVLENRHRKIFCTVQAFKSIPLKAATIEAYEAHLMRVDPSYEPSEKKGETERAASKLSDVVSAGEKSSAIPYFEDMGIDSIVIDEAHQYKNSKQTVEFSGAKFLSIAPVSDQGADMQMKCWYIRGLTPLADGVMPLTATPITNSPLEIYAMLTLAVGEERVHDLTMGARGADAFMNAMCQIEDDEETTVDGLTKPYRVFRGLMNVDMLRSAINSIATIKTGADVKLAGDDLRLPDSPELPTRITLPRKTVDRLGEYKMAYRAAKDAIGMAGKDALPPTEEEIAALERVQARFGEPIELIAHPFNLIQKMTDLIADPELDDRATFYDFNPAQREQAEKAVAAFNKLGKIEQRDRPGRLTEKEHIVGQKAKGKKRADGSDDEKVVLRIRAQAYFENGRIAIDTLEPGTQSAFEKEADKAGLELDCSVPPKLAALLANVQEEQAHNRNKSGPVKQIVFCDILPMLNKIKLVLSKRCGIPKSAIAIITGPSIKDAEQMQDIQDGFNANDEDSNKYRLVLANKKAEVGVNLQKGTQAIHHITIGWTPDSQHQRNGRGVRQGNDVDYVNVYHYDAEGTFDQYKRTLTTKKSDWIGAVMSQDGGNEVEISGSLTNEQYDKMVNSMGDPEKIAAIQREAEEDERRKRGALARQRQMIALDTFNSQAAFLAEHTSADKFVAKKASALFEKIQKLDDLKNRDRSKMSERAVAKLEANIAVQQAAIDQEERELVASARYEPGYGKSGLPALFAKALEKKGASARKVVEDAHYSIKPIEGSPLVTAYQEEVGAAKAMQDEALKSFETIAANNAGALPAKIAMGFRKGEGQIVNGTPVVPGMFARTKAGTLYVVGGPVAYRFPSDSLHVTSIVHGGGEVIGFDHPDYDSLVSEAAKIDDSNADKVTTNNRPYLFSSHIAAVGTRMTKPVMIRYDVNEVKLPSPHFPYAIVPGPSMSPVLAGLFEAQKAVIDSWPSDNYVVIDSAVEVERLSRGYSGVPSQSSNRVQALIDYAIGGGTPLPLTDYKAVLGPYEMTYLEYLRRAAKWPSYETLTSIFAACETEEEVEAALVRITATAVGAFLAADSIEGAAKTIADWNVTSRANDRMRSIRVAAEAAARAAEAAANPAPVPEPEPAAEPVAAVAVDSGVTPNAKGMIGIKGETRPHKEKIKQAAKDAGGYAKWDGEAVLWIVPAATWSVLCNNYAAVARAVYPVPI